MDKMDRREFFRSLFLQKKQTIDVKRIRPPYNNDDVLFQRYCKECGGKCVGVCEEEIIRIDKEDNTPYLDFKENGCTFCQKCAEACDFGVLDTSIYEGINKVNALPAIGESECLAWNKVICSSCREICPEKAIKFLVLWNPKVQADKCTGCGLCISVCPKEAIKISAL